MKNLITRFLVSAIIAASLVMIGCDKETNPTAPTTQKPTAPKVSFDGPNTQSTNPYAQQAKGFSQMFNGFAMQFSTLTDIPGGTQNGNVWTYTFNYGTFSETITVEVMGDGSYKWKVTYSGQYEDNGTQVTLNNWTAFEGTSSADGKSGSWKFYMVNTTTLEAEILWSTDAQGNESGILKVYENGVLTEQLNIMNNVDGSGSMQLYSQKSNSTQTYLSMEITWLANGTGMYKIYNESGAITESGTF